MFRIRSNSEIDDETKEPLYWNDLWGWVDKEEADIYENWELSMPLDSIKEYIRDLR